MNRTSVQSSHLSSVGYDFDRHILEIEFRGGEVYQYFGVPEWEYNGLMAASSHGQYLDRQIKKGPYRYVQVG
ncbi:MAG: KTSC domain-containing protein [Cyanobacteria bacterium P01_G01_bin.54]